MATPQFPPVIRFGDFEADLAARELRKNGKRIKLSGQPFEVLALLLRRRGELVTREELRAQLWRDDTFVDFDHSLNAAVNKLREALGDSIEEPRFVKTMPRRGYRFIAPVDAPPSLPAAPETKEEDVVVASAPSVAAGRRIRSPVVLAAVVVVGLVVLGTFVWRRAHPRSQPAVARIMLAVLPFENLTGDPNQDYFSDGLTEEMITQLGGMQPERLGVIARTSVMPYKRGDRRVDVIGRDLGVQYVLEGSLRRTSGRVRVTAQLIQVKDQAHVWAEEYDRELRDVLALQGEVARAIAREIRIQLTPQEHAHLVEPRSVSPEAYEAYLKGEYYRYRLTPEALSKAIDYFEQAIAKDPSYAPAYARLSSCYVNLAGRLPPPKEAMPKANAAALRALALDPNLGQSHASLGNVKFFYEFDWAGAGREYKRALELDPGDPGIHVLVGNYLIAQGEADQAAKEYSRARELDPLSVGRRCSEGRGLYYAHQYDRAIEQYKAAREMDPKFVGHCIWLGLTYEQKGMMGEAITEIQSVVNASPNETLPLAVLARAYGLMGQKEEAHRLIRQLTELSKKRYVSPYDVAVAYTGLGDRNQVMAWLEKAYENRAGLLVYIKVDSVFDGLRSDPRFADLVRRVGLP